jgi:hypothetical protein
MWEPQHLYKYNLSQGGIFMQFVIFVKLHKEYYITMSKLIYFIFCAVFFVLPLIFNLY